MNIPPAVQPHDITKWLRLGGHRAGLSASEKGFYPLEVSFGVYAYGVEVGGGYVDVEAVFEKAELFEALCDLEGAVGQGRKLVEG
jgi:hypothetical protein